MIKIGNVYKRFADSIKHKCMFGIKTLDDYFTQHRHIGLLILRVFIGGRLLYGVLDNVFSWDRMLEFAAFLSNNNFPFPTYCAVLSVYTQLICGALVLIGYKTRVASFLLVINFIVALVFVHIRSHDSIEGMTPALAMLGVSLALLFTGAGRYSLDDYFTR